MLVFVLCRDGQNMMGGVVLVCGCCIFFLLFLVCLLCFFVLCCVCAFVFVLML